MVQFLKRLLELQSNHNGITEELHEDDVLRHRNM